jgi:DNA-binding cell septation regulator SpoVG
MGPDEANVPLVTEVRIQPTREPPILAFASITLWGLLVVHDLRILLRRDGSTVVLMPRMHSPEGGWTTVAHPVNEETRVAIETAVLSAYAQARAAAVTPAVAAVPPAIDLSSPCSVSGEVNRRTA